MIDVLDDELEELIRALREGDGATIQRMREHNLVALLQLQYFRNGAMIQKAKNLLKPEREEIDE